MAPHTSTLPITENPIALSEETVQAIVPELDRHVASLFVLFHQYQKHHWLVEGPQFRDLHLYLEEAYEEIHEDLDDIAERMTVLGGVPTSSPTVQARRAYIEHEAEGETPVRDMLTADLAAEQAVIQHLRATIALAQEHTDYGTEHLLKTVLAGAEARAHHLDHYLQANTLVRPRSRSMMSVN